jgi:hypothetical protein
VRRHAVSIRRSKRASDSAGGRSRAGPPLTRDDGTGDLDGDLRRRPPGGQPVGGRRVGRDRHLGSGLRVARRPAEQQAVQRGGGAAGRRRPPGHHLALRAGERDVEQPQLLAVVLGVGGRLRASQPGPPLPPTSSTAALLVVQPQGRRVCDAVVLSQPNGSRTTGNSSPCCACTVTTCTAAASVSSGGCGPRRRRVSGSSTRSASHVTSELSPSACSRGGAVERLREVAQVGEAPLAPARPRAGARRAGLGGQVLEGGREPRVGEAARPRRAAGRPRVELALGRRVEPLGRPAEQRRERSQAARPARCGCSSACSSHSQSRALGGREDAVLPDSTHGTPARSSAACTSAACTCLRTSTAMSPGPHDVPARQVQRRPAARAGGRRRRRRRRRPARAARRPPGKPVCPAARAGASEDAQPQRRLAGQAGGRVQRRHRAARRCPGARAPRRRRGGRARAAAGVGAPAGAERLLPTGDRAGGQVGQHLRAAEGVDGLLRVADEHQRGPLPWKAVRRISHCTGSVSWNSSTSTTRYCARSRRQAAARAPASAAPRRAG